MRGQPALGCPRKERRQRNAAARPRPLRKATAAIAAAALAVPAWGGTALPAAAAGRAPWGPLDRAGLALVNKARGEVLRAHPACSPPPLAVRQPRVSNAPVPKGLTSLLGVMRRAQTAAERSLVDDHMTLGAFWFTPVAYRLATRIATAPDGTQLAILAGLTGRKYIQSPHLYDACQRAVRARLVVLARSSRPKVARRALSIQRQLAADERPKPLPRYFLTLNDYVPADGGLVSGSGGPFDVARFERRGVLMTGGRPGSTRVSALVPDGVTAVSVEYGPDRSGTRVMPGLDLTVRVADNVLSYTVGRSPERAFPDRMLWRRTDGSRIGGWRVP